MIIVLWGVAGSGKSTVAAELNRLQCDVFDADFHPKSNIRKMAERPTVKRR